MLYTFDILFNFSTGYFDRFHILVMKRRAIRRHYLGRMFLLDLIAALPIALILRLTYPVVYENVFLLAKIPRLFTATTILRRLNLTERPYIMCRLALIFLMWATAVHLYVTGCRA